MSSPKLLDLFCGAGGAAKGYADAGFEVVGVDIEPQPNYPFEFHQMDALEAGTYSYDAIHASPPCQRYSNLRHAAARKGKDQPDLIAPTRALLEAAGVPYVMENVPGAPMRHAVELCGSMFGLGAGGRQLRRHRLFETNFPIVLSRPLRCQHQGEAIGVYGGGPTGRYTFGNGAKKDYYGRRGGYQGRIDEKCEAMGIDWMTASEINQAIPPAYSRFLGEQLMTHLNARAAA